MHKNGTDRIKHIELDLPVMVKNNDDKGKIRNKNTFWYERIL